MLRPLWEPVLMGLSQRVVEALRDLPPGVHEAVPADVRRGIRHRLGRFYAWEAGYDHHHTPVPAADEESGPPGFVGIGVQKAGTSWWHRLIIDHPQVSDRPSIHKERHFFARFGAEQFTATDVADYHAWFPRKIGTITGEWTPDYFAYPWVPPLMAKAAPDTRLLVILRDPVQRFRSGLAHQIRNGADHVGSSQAEALGRSLYADSLRRWRANFPAEQLLVLQYEQCVADPSGQLARTYAHLGLDEGHRPADLAGEVNKTVEGKADLPADARARLEEIVAADIADLTTQLPEFDFSLWTSAKGGAA
jgi:Sulfotransferase family